MSAILISGVINKNGDSLISLLTPDIRSRNSGKAWGDS